MDQPYRLRLLGPIMLDGAGAALPPLRSRKALALLGYLACQEQPVARSLLVGMFWGETSDARARHNLTRELSQLTMRLHGCFHADYHSVQWAPADPHCVDTAACAALLAPDPAAPAARPHQTYTATGPPWASDTWFVRAGADGRDPVRLEAAVALYRSEFLAGLYLDGCPEFETWLVRERERWRRQITGALEALVLYHALRQADERAQTYARRWLELEPWQEDAHRYLLVLLARNGKRSAALAQYEACQRVLEQERGIAPARENVALYEQIRADGFEQPAGRQALGQAPGAQAPAPDSAQRWDEAPTINTFYGRELERITLERWLVDERCRLVAVVGMGGVGKTALAAMLVDQTAPQFDAVMWCSLLNAPPLADTLRRCLQLVELPMHLEDQLALVLDLLRRRRCLLVFDNLEGILDSGKGAGSYRPGYEGYGQLLRRVGESDHHSCLLLTSREQPLGFALLAAGVAQIRSLRLGGLPTSAGYAMLHGYGLALAPDASVSLITRYSGNPLALQLVAETIRDLFGGDTTAFLHEQALIFDDIRAVLDQQFTRLSNLERELLLWLAIEREPVATQRVGDRLIKVGSRRAVIEALRALQRQSLLESHGAAVTLQNVVMEYATDYLIERLARELGDGQLSYWHSHALLLAQAKEYIRQTQTRLFLQPIAERLVTHLGRAGLARRLGDLLDSLRAEGPQSVGYAAANILHLALHLGYDLRDFDFSQLSIRQAYLRGLALPGVNFAGANLTESAFTDTLGAIYAVAFSPDARILAAAAGDRTIHLWDISTNQLAAVCEGHTNLVRSIAFSPDGRLLISGSWDRTVRVWDAHSGKALNVLHGYAHQIEAVACSPDSASLASGDAGCLIAVRDAASGQERYVLRGHTATIRSLDFSPDGASLASSGDDSTVRLWDARTGQLLRTLEGHTGWLNAVAFSPDGTILASGGDDSTVRLWEARTGQLLRILEGHTNWVNAVAFSPDSTTLASGSDDHTVRLWDARTGQLRRVLQVSLQGVTSVSFSADNMTLASGTYDQAVWLWEAHSGRVLQKLQGHLNWIWAIAFSHDNATLVSAGADHTVRIWNVRTAQVERILYGHTGWIRSVALSLDGRMLASGGADQTVRLWDLSSGRLICQLDGHDAGVQSVVFSPDSTMLASSGEDQIVRLWDARTGHLYYTLHGHSGWVRTVAFSPDGTTLASGGADQTVRLWDVRTKQMRQVLQGHTHDVWSLAFRYDGHMLASCGDDSTVRLWETGTGRLCHVLQGQPFGVKSVAFSPDGATVASGGDDQQIRLWDTVTGQLRHVLQGHSHWLFAVAFRPDGAILASSGADETIRLWDTQTGSCIQMLHTSGPYAGMNITGITGVSEAQRATLRALGALEDDRQLER